MAYFHTDNRQKKSFRSCLLATSSYISYLLILYCLIMMHQPMHSLDGSPTELMEDQIIVKYKDPCHSPLGTNFIEEPVLRTPYSFYQNEHSAICPNRTDLVLIKTKNPQALIEELSNNPDIEYAVPNIIKKIGT